MMDIGKDLQNAYDEGYKQGRFDEKVESERWIPCSERLPNENENVLADDGIDMFVAWYNNGWNSTDHACDPYTYIIAWMPLPTPYKGGESE